MKNFIKKNWYEISVITVVIVGWILIATGIIKPPTILIQK